MKIANTLQPGKKLFFVIPALSEGGAERVLISLANHFANLQFEPVIIALNHSIPVYMIDKRVEIIYFAKRNEKNMVNRLFYMVQTLNKLIYLLIKYRPICVLSFITSANIWTGIACLATGTPYIVSERNSPNRTVNKLNYIFNKLTSFLYKKSVAVVVSAKGVEDCIRKNTEFSNITNIVRITNAVPEFDAVSATRVHDRKFILAVGRLEYVKGFDQLIDAFKQANLSDIDLLIVGNGSKEPALVRQVNNLGLKGRVTFTGAKTNLQDYYSQAALFVLPSRNEGYPNVLVEAMSFGCACIAMDCEFGPSEIIDHKINGILVPPGDISDLSDAMTYLLSDPEFKDLIGRAALKINKTNSSKTILGNWEDLILNHACNYMGEIQKQVNI